MSIGDIGVVTGVIELKDEFTSTLGLAQIALGQFSKENQESLTAIAEVGGLVAAAFLAIGAAVAELGTKGAAVQNVENTLDHFTGSVQASADVMDRLKSATLGTVGDFELASDAAHLLSAGVKLTADQFATLGAAAELLHKRGLGDTKDELELVSNAMITGRTRALTLALGVIDLKGAEEKYAESLGVTVGQLSVEGVAEAKRQAIMELLTRSVKDAGTQQRDFGEQIKASSVAVENWVDDLGQAIATSPALAAGLKVASAAVAQAFGSENSQAIKSTVEFIKSAVIVGADFALGAVEAARVVNVAWSLIKSVILGVETGIVSLVVAIGDVLLAGEKMANKLNLVPDSEVAKVKATQEGLENLQHALDAETQEAAKGITGHSEFDKTLDHLGGTIFQVRDAVEASSATMDKGNAETDVATRFAAALAKEQAGVAQSMVDRAKVEAALWKTEEKSLQETTVLWDQYFSLIAANNGTSFDGAKKAIQSWFNDEVSKLDASDRNWQNHYDALAAIAGEKLKAIEVDWASVRDLSLEALQETADKASATYDAMISSSLHFTRAALQEQLQKVRDTQEAARGMGQTFIDAETKAAAAAEAQKKSLEDIAAAAEKAAQALRDEGGSFAVPVITVTSANLGQLKAELAAIEQDYAMLPGRAPGGSGATGLTSNDDAGYRAMLAEQVRYQSLKNALPGFAQGGMVDIRVGENGPEAVRVPVGSQVFPTGTMPGGGGGTTVTNHIYVNGTAADVARKVSKEIMDTLKRSRQFGSA